MHVSLRPQTAADLPVLTGGQSPFDDFGPSQPEPSPRPASLDRSGALSVVVADAGGAGRRDPDDDVAQPDVAQPDVAGLVSWHWQQWGPNEGSRCPMIGIWLRPEHRGRGIGTAAQRQLVDLFFRHTAANRVEAHTDVENVAEQRALEAAGFQREGITRGAQWRDGAYHDGYLYAVLRGDPRPGPRPD